MAKRLTTRFVPHVTFVMDEGIKKSIEIARLIREAQGGTPAADEAEAGDDSDDAGTGSDAADGPAGHPPR